MLFNKETIAQFIKFCVVGGIGVVVNLGITYCFTEFFGIWYMASNFIGICFAVVSNFIGNKWWTFKC